MITVTQARPEDADSMSRILAPILLSWNSARPSTPEHVLAHYITHPDGIRCSVAREDTGRMLGFQSLKRASEGNAFGLPVGWGIIGTYVDTSAGRKGVGKRLFAATLKAARAAGLTEIDATIGDRNAAGLAYYEAMGFETYRTTPSAICKRFLVR